MSQVNEAYAWECDAINAGRKVKRLEAENERLRKVLGRVASKEWNDQAQIKEYVHRMLEK